jgi:glycosyltransferase involved in cell wall biosynthesis
MSTKVLDLELSKPWDQAGVALRHQNLRLLVRLHGTPLGYVDVENQPAELTLDALQQRVVGQLGETLWAGLLAEQWANDADAAADEDDDKPPISVVVCTRDRADVLEGCLAALAAQNYPDFEVIVVDNASKDDTTREVASRFPFRYVQEARPGLDWARNRGLAEALSSIVAYTDDDARPDPEWLTGLAKGFASDVDVVTGLVVPAELETIPQYLFEDAYGGMGKGFQPVLHSCRGRKRVTFTPNQYGTGCNMAFRKDALQRIGGFDPALDVGTPTGGGGDIDAFQRVLETGGALLYRPDAVVRHIHRRSLGKLRGQLFDNGRSYSAVLWACMRRARGIDRLRVVHAYWQWFGWWHLRRIVRRLFGREKMPMRLIFDELRGGLLGVPLYRRARGKAQELARAAE